MVRTTPTGKDPNVVYSLGHSAGEQLSAASGPRTVPSKRRLGRLDRPGARRGPVSMPGVADAGSSTSWPNVSGLGVPPWASTPPATTLRWQRRASSLLSAPAQTHVSYTKPLHPGIARLGARRHSQKRTALQRLCTAMPRRLRLNRQGPSTRRAPTQRGPLSRRERRRRKAQRDRRRPPARTSTRTSRSSRSQAPCPSSGQRVAPALQHRSGPQSPQSPTSTRGGT